METDTNENDRSKKSGDEARRSPPPRPIIQVKIDRKKCEAEADKGEESEQVIIYLPRDGKAVEWVAIVLSGLLGLIALWIYNSQLVAMTEANRLLKASTDAATKAANIAEAALKKTESLSHLDQRAWVSVRVGTDAPEVGKVFTVQTTAHNNGKTFARDFQSRIAINIVERDAEPAFALGRREAAKAAGSVSVLPPTGEYSTATDVEPDGKPGPITQEIFDNLRSGRTKLFVFGWVTYFDIFGCDHWTIFCNELLPGNTPGNFKWRTYTTHNDADVNECAN